MSRLGIESGGKIMRVNVSNIQNKSKFKMDQPL